MKVIKGNIWDFKDGYIGITTNGMLSANGKAVMGAGLAFQAQMYFPDLPTKLGNAIRKHGNNVYIFQEYSIVTIPTKTDWKNSSDLKLIEKSCRELRELWKRPDRKKLYLVKLGCGLGNLSWSQVEPIMDKYLDSRFIVVEP